MLDRRGETDLDGGFMVIISVETWSSLSCNTQHSGSQTDGPWWTPTILHLRPFRHLFLVICNSSEVLSQVRCCPSTWFEKPLDASSPIFARTSLGLSAFHFTSSGHQRFCAMRKSTVRRLAFFCLPFFPPLCPFSRTRFSHSDFFFLLRPAGLNAVRPRNEADG